MDSHPEFLRSVLIYINSSMKSRKKLNLDIIYNEINIGKMFQNNRANTRRIKLKNVVIQIIRDNLVERHKPSLFEVVKYFMEKGVHLDRKQKNYQLMMQ